ncbi:MAG: O-antigen ligase family protein, partial [Gemmatimonadaceae bacterium]|nr:O-antigen ligase family protein [Gemmatimonadaceae bacterium]
MSALLAAPGAAAVGAALFLFLAAWCFSHRRVDVSLAALGLYLGLLDGYLKLRTGNQFVTLGRDLLVAAIAGGALVRALQSRQPLPLPPLGGFVLAFSAVVMIELFNPEGRGLAGGLAGVRQHLEFVPLFFLGYAVVRRESQIEKLLLILVACAAVGGIVSYVQSTLTPDQLANWGPGYRERILGSGAFAGSGRTSVDPATGTVSVRPFGLGSDAGAGAVVAVLALPALLAMLMVSSGRLRLAMVLPAVGIALAIATSGSRTSLITALVSLLAFGFIVARSRDSLRVITGVTVGAVLLYGAFDQLVSRDNQATERTRSIVSNNAFSTFERERASSLNRFDDYALAYPLGIGVGYGGPAASVSGSGANVNVIDRKTGLPLNYETQWNYLVLELGLAGLLLFLMLSLRVVMLAFRHIRR